MTKTQITVPPGQPTIEMTREFDAPRDLVFRAHTEPDLLVQWLGPHGMEMTVDHFEARDGGTWRYTHKGEDGIEYGFHGVFHGTPSPEAIVQTFEFEGAPGHVSLETMTLEERNGRTTLRATSVFQSVAARDAMAESGMESGVNDGYDKLDTLLATEKAAR